MSSINTNTAAMTALQSLTQTNKMLTQTQGHISTGLRVSEASDNAAYWSIATTMRSDKASLSTVQDALGLGASMVDVTYTAMSSAIDVVNSIKSKLVAAREPGVDKTKIQTEIAQLQKQLKGIADSASFSGQNWLSVELERRRLQCHAHRRLVVQPNRHYRKYTNHRYRHVGDGPLRRKPCRDRCCRRHSRRQPDRGRRHR